MSSRDPRFSPEQSNIFQHDGDMPYARRSVSGVFFIIAIVFCAAMFAGWYFFPAENKVAEAETEVLYPASEAMQRHMQVTNGEVDDSGAVAVATEDNAVSPSAAPTSSPQTQTVEATGNEESGDGGVVETLGTLFGGGSLNNMMPQMKGAQSSADVMLNVQNYYEEIEAPKDGFSHSVHRVIGADVHNVKSEIIGEVQDILVDARTGEAQRIIASSSSNQKSLVSFGFNQILSQSPAGEVHTDAEDIEQFPVFDYKDPQWQGNVSLRYLNEGQMLDFEGRLAGEIDTIIYENAKAQTIIFTLSGIDKPNGTPQIFGVSFDKAKIVRSKDGYDVVLNKEQTTAMAKRIVEPAAGDEQAGGE